MSKINLNTKKTRPPEEFEATLDSMLEGTTQLPSPKSAAAKEMAEKAGVPVVNMPLVQDEVLSASAISSPAPRRASLLSEQVAALAASLDVPTSEGNAAYEPDAFVAAVRSMHDKLLNVAERLAAQNARQAEREAELTRREAEVTFREKRANAFDQLVEVKRGGLFAKLFG